ncbi:hypothetical protein [Klebsiella michiganensis]|uniref:hypothetical protein n=1 Tax=Klebsiella michiganensis TaxID=1134687 RepID=UPI0007CD14BD|nr:Uncharacterised protein [Klebsiella michiganensis]
MTTDITELAQSLKRRAASANEFGEGLFFIKADDVLALVEALEKAQQRIDSQREYYEGVIADGGKRIAELEEAEQKLCAANITLDARAELAERQLAELDSRTVTVKLPTTRLWAGVTECYEKSDVIAAIRSAGMEVSDD